MQAHTGSDKSLFDRMVESSVERLMPVRAVFEITYRCNLLCPFCYRVERPISELDTEEVKTVISDLKAEGCAFLTLTGGEPLSRPDFWQIAGFARAQSLALEIKTNGVLVDDDAADRIADLLVLNVDISLYGATAERHDRLTLVPGSFDGAVRAIGLVRDRGLRVTVKSLLTQDNFEEHLGIRRLAESLGADCVFDVSVTGSQDGRVKPDGRRITDSQLAEFIGSYVEDYRDVLGGAPEQEQAAIGNCPGCLAGVSTCCIGPYGDVYPCVQLAKSAGNVRQASFRKIWRESSELERLRRIGLEDLESCRECELQQFCLRCPGLALLEDGDLLGPSAEACRVARACCEALTPEAFGADQERSKREPV